MSKLNQIGNQQTIIKSEKQRIVYAPVYTPYRVDTDNEAMIPAEIEKMAHDFMRSGKFDHVDVQHDRIKSGCCVLESFVARKNDPDFVEGEWVLAVQIMRDDLWALVQKGELNGFSFGSSNIPTRMGYLVDLLQPISGYGTTEKSEPGTLPAHEHEVEIEFAEDATIIPTQTGNELGHSHAISRATATEEAMGHSHRLELVSN